MTRALPIITVEEWRKLLLDTPPEERARRLLFIVAREVRSGTSIESFANLLSLIEVKP